MTAPPLAITQPDGSRKYVHPVTGEVCPSVTSILKVISRPALDGWAARLTAKYAVDNWQELSEADPAERLETLKHVHENERQVKADRGSLVHDMADMWAKGSSMIHVTKSTEGFMTQFYGFLADVNPEYLESEATCWNRTYGYAGTLDFVAKIDGEVVLVDIKTSPRCYPEHGLQLAALSHCEFVIEPDGTEREMPRITRHALLNLRPRSWKLIPVWEMEANYSAFLSARKIHHWLSETAPSVLGTP